MKFEDFEKFAIKKTKVITGGAWLFWDYNTGQEWCNEDWSYYDNTIIGTQEVSVPCEAWF